MSNILCLARLPSYLSKPTKFFFRNRRETHRRGTIHSVRGGILWGLGHQQDAHTLEMCPQPCTCGQHSAGHKKKAMNREGNVGIQEGLEGNVRVRRIMIRIQCIMTLYTYMKFSENAF